MKRVNGKSLLMMTVHAALRSAQHFPTLLILLDQYQTTYAEMPNFPLPLKRRRQYSITVEPVRREMRTLHVVDDKSARSRLTAFHHPFFSTPNHPLNHVNALHRITTVMWGATALIKAEWQPFRSPPNPCCRHQHADGWTTQYSGCTPCHASRITRFPAP